MTKPNPAAAPPQPKPPKPTDPPPADPKPTDPPDVEEGEEDGRPAEEPDEGEPSEPVLTWEEVLKAMDERKDPALTGDEPAMNVDFNKVMDDLESGTADPAQVKALLKAMRGMGTKRTQRLAEKEKLLDQARQEMEDQRRALLSGDFRRGVDEGAKPKEPPKLDPFDPKSVAAYVEHEVKQRVAQALQGMVGEIEKADTNQRQAREYAEFKAQYPELTTEEYRVPIAKLLKENDGKDGRPYLTLQQAFAIVDSGIQRKGRKAAEEEAAGHRRTLQERGLQTGSGSRVKDLREVPQHLLDSDDPNDLLEYLEAQAQQRK
jgi:hypothetical protein